MIINNIVYGESALKVPGHLSCGQYILDSLMDITKKGDMTAIVNGETGEKTTYKELLQETVNVAAGLKNLGVKPGVVVALISENMSQFITAFLGILCCGATATNLGVIYSADELEHLLNISKATMIICSEECLKKHYKIMKCLPFIKKIIQLNGETVDDNIFTYKSIMVETNVNEYEPEDVKGASDTAVILYSSGTTGLPKGVMITHFNMLYSMTNFDVENIYSEEFSNILSVVPWYHVYGLMLTLTYLKMSKRIIYLPRYTIEKYLRTIQEYKANILISVPSIIVSIAKSSLATEYDLSSVRIVWCGAAPLNADTIKTALNHMPKCYGIYGNYGMTETSMAAAKDPEQYAYVPKPGSSGVPVPGMKFKIVDINSGKILGPNEEGEIRIKGPLLMKGYLNKEKETKEAFDDDGYLKSGDIGYYDQDGYFFIVDRLKELIKYKGYQVTPAFIERIVLQHPGVVDCGVVGAPDELAGELPVAFVVKKEGVTLSEHDLLEFTNTKVPFQEVSRGKYCEDS